MEKEKVFILKESEMITLLQVATLATIGITPKSAIKELENINGDLLMYALAAAKTSRKMKVINEVLEKLLKDCDKTCED